MTDGGEVPATVAVVSWNTRELLGHCLAALLPDFEAGRADIWVVDNGSEDGSPDLVTESFPWVHLIASRENLGFGPAVNLVAGRTSTHWIAAANADVELRPGALEALLERGSAQAQVGSLAPRLVVPGGAVQHSVHSFPSLRLALAFNLGLTTIVPGLGDRLCLEGRWDHRRERDVDWAHGAFLLLRRRAFEAAGGFDPSQWMYAEDLDLAWRLRQAGWRTRYVPAAAARHEVSAAARQAFAERRTDRHMAAAHAWMVRRRGAAAARLYAALNACGAAARWLALTPLAALMPGRYGARQRLERRYAALHARGLRPRGDANAAVNSIRGNEAA
jgi:GT2 family glycosyltransferase